MKGGGERLVDGSATRQEWAWQEDMKEVGAVNRFSQEKCRKS